jgi:hypothetical protein
MHKPARRAISVPAQGTPWEEEKPIPARLFLRYEKNQTSKRAFLKRGGQFLDLVQAVFDASDISSDGGLILF